MKKLKLRLDDLRESMELLELEDLGSFKGGTGGYYGYNSWADFTNAALNGQVEDGCYFDNGTSGGAGVHGDPWMYGEGGGGYGQYGQYGYGDYDFVQFLNSYGGQMLDVDGNLAMQGTRPSGYCVFYALQGMAKELGISGDYLTFKLKYKAWKDAKDGGNVDVGYITTNADGESSTTFGGVPGAEYHDFVKFVAGTANYKKIDSAPASGFTGNVVSSSTVMQNVNVEGVTVMACIQGTPLHAVEITGFSNGVYQYKDSITGKPGSAPESSFNHGSFAAVKKSSATFP